VNWMKQAREACLELVSTEQNYVEVLRVINVNFRKPLERWVAHSEKELDGAASASGSGRSMQSDPMVTGDEVAQMFGQVELAYKMHQDFLTELIEARDKAFSEGPVENMEDYELCAALAESLGAKLEVFALGKSAQGTPNSYNLNCYKVHIPEYEKMRTLTIQLREERPQLQFAMEMLERVDPAQKLGSLLINTVTRLPRYILLCREVLKNLQKLEEAERAHKEGLCQLDLPFQADQLEQATNQMTDAFEAVRSVTSNTNKMMALAERKQTAISICEKLGVEQDPHREFIMESSDMIKLRRAKSLFGGGRNSLNRSNRTAYLFTDSVLVTKGTKKGETYVFKYTDLILISADDVYSSEVGLRECWHLTGV